MDNSYTAFNQTIGPNTFPKSATFTAVNQAIGPNSVAKMATFTAVNQAFGPNAVAKNSGVINYNGSDGMGSSRVNYKSYSSQDPFDYPYNKDKASKIAAKAMKRAEKERARARKAVEKAEKEVERSGREIERANMLLDREKERAAREIERANSQIMREAERSQKDFRPIKIGSTNPYDNTIVEFFISKTGSDQYELKCCATVIDQGGRSEFKTSTFLKNIDPEEKIYFIDGTNIKIFRGSLLNVSPDDTTMNISDDKISIHIGNDYSIDTIRNQEPTIFDRKTRKMIKPSFIVVGDEYNKQINTSSTLSGKQ